MDYHLKFDSEEHAKSVLYRKEGVVEANTELGIVASEGYDVPNFKQIDIIGVIYKPTGNTLTNDEGREYPEMSPIDGYHVNIRDDLTPEQEEQLPLVQVETPVRVWF